MKFRTFAGLVVLVLIVGVFLVTRGCRNNHSSSSIKTSQVMVTEDRPQPSVSQQSRNQDAT